MERESGTGGVLTLGGVSGRIELKRGRDGGVVLIVAALSPALASGVNPRSS